MVTFRVLLGLTLTLWCTADYPPHDLAYRVHYHDLYPKEAPKSKLCIGRKNGAYGHHNLTLGDPRCTYVVCSNSRPVIQSCPRGTRTMYDIKPSILTRALFSRLSRHGYHENHLRGTPFAKSHGGAASGGQVSLKGGATSAAESAANNIEAGPAAQLSKEPYRGYNVHVYSPLYFNHKMCNIHDVNGVCGDPFPDMNAYGNEVPKTDLVDGVDS